MPPVFKDSLFDRLPIDIQYRILGLVPIIFLIVCKAVSRSWRSIIRSSAFMDSYPRDLSRRRNDVIFLFSSVSAYVPSCDRWLRLQHPVPFHRVLIRGSSLLLVRSPERDFGGKFCIFNPFSRDRSLRHLPVILNPERPHKALALIEDNPSDYKILVVSIDGILHSQIYDSRSTRWESCPTFAGICGSLRSAAYLDGLLFCLSCYPDLLLAFDPVSRQWSVLDLAMPVPSLSCRDILVFGGDIYLTGYVMENTRATRFEIWKLDRSAMAWSEFSFMPDEYSADFSPGRLHGMRTVDCMGILCFRSEIPGKSLMYDMATRSCWWPRPCDVSRNELSWLAYFMEPSIDLLK